MTVAENPSTVAVVKRPWDWSQPAATSKVSTATTAVRAPNERNGQTQTPALEGAAVTRMDSTHPATVVGTQDLGRRIRVQQLRQAAAIGLWLAVIALIALVVFIGSQPARPDF